jgi:hypothetical protein
VRHDAPSAIGEISLTLVGRIFTEYGEQAVFARSSQLDTSKNRLRERLGGV